MLELDTGVIIRHYDRYSSIPDIGCTYFSFVNDSNETNGDTKVFDKLSYDMYCREQLSQMSLGFLTNKFLPVSVPKLTGIFNNIDNIKLQIIIGGIRARNRFLKNIDKFLRPYEESLGVREFKVYPVINVNHSFILDLDSKWLSSPLLVSIVALIIRVAIEHPKLNRYDTIENFFRSNLKYSGVISSFNHIDLHYLLRNIDEVLGDNPITGFDDFKYGFSNPEITTIIEAYLNSYTLESGKTIELKTVSIHNIGVSCGLLSLSYRVYKAMNKLEYKQDLDEEVINILCSYFGKDYYVNPLGLKWVCNLIKLLSKNK